MKDLHESSESGSKRSSKSRLRWICCRDEALTDLFRRRPDIEKHVRARGSLIEILDIHE